MTAMFVLTKESGEYSNYSMQVLGVYASVRLAMRSAARLFPMASFTWRAGGGYSDVRDYEFRREFGPPDGALTAGGTDHVLTIIPYEATQELGPMPRHECLKMIRVLRNDRNIPH